MTAAVALLILLIAADIGLWALAIVAPLSSAGRFRAFALAALIMVIICGNLFSWGQTIAVAAIVAWVAAIVVANSKTLATE